MTVYVVYYMEGYATPEVHIAGVYGNERAAQSVVDILKRRRRKVWMAKEDVCQTPYYK